MLTRSRARLKRPGRALLAIPFVVAAAVSASVTTARGAPPPIEHVVLILQENHSFDNTLGQLCIQDKREKCAAASSGQNEKGETIRLSKAADLVVKVDHTQTSQLTAIHNGKMDGWEKVIGCSARSAKRCYTAYEPRQIPSLAALARAGAISDHFFSRDIVPSWGAHLDLFAQTLDGFVGNNPVHLQSAPPARAGWGCDSNLDAEWIEPISKKVVNEPSCIPNQKGEGPYRKSPVPYVPTIADRLEEAGKTWGIFGATDAKDTNGYMWATCPIFAECLFGPQKSNLHDNEEFIADAKAGTLPSFSLLTPQRGVAGSTSQHNATSMIVGDNHIGEEVSAIQRGPNGSTTTIFIYYDDCGCFYDHVAPPTSLGIRLPLVIVSPYAKKGFTDNNVTTNSSILAYAEKVLHVRPVTEADKTAYDFHEAFKPEPSAARFSFQPAPVPQSSQNLPAAPANEDT